MKLFQELSLAEIVLDGVAISVLLINYKNCEDQLHSNAHKNHTHTVRLHINYTHFMFNILTHDTYSYMWNKYNNIFNVNNKYVDSLRKKVNIYINFCILILTIGSLLFAWQTNNTFLYISYLILFYRKFIASLWPTLYQKENRKKIRRKNYDLCFIYFFYFFKCQQNRKKKKMKRV